MRKIGVFGGTFDPVHEGHILVANGVMANCDLDQILFVPAWQPPHKPEPVASFRHRVAMLEAAVADTPEFSVSTIESERLAPSYTHDTLIALDRLGPATLSLIIGADSFIELHLWCRYVELLNLADLIVVARPGIHVQQIESAATNLPHNYISVPDQVYPQWKSLKAGRQISYLQEPEVSISSSDIRDRLSRGQSVSNLVPEEVLDYIVQNNLYGTGIPTT